MIQSVWVQARYSAIHYNLAKDYHDADLFYSVIIVCWAICTDLGFSTTWDTTWDKHNARQKTKWLFFTASRSGAKIVQDSFHASKIDNAWLTKKKAIYIADIHAAPSLIVNMFVLPKMRKYPYSVGLDPKGDITQNWQKTKDGVSIFKLKNLKVIKIIQLKNLQSTKLFLRKRDWKMI